MAGCDKDYDGFMVCSARCACATRFRGCLTRLKIMHGESVVLSATTSRLDKLADTCLSLWSVPTFPLSQKPLSCLERQFPDTCYVGLLTPLGDPLRGPEHTGVIASIYSKIFFRSLSPPSWSASGTGKDSLVPGELGNHGQPLLRSEYAWALEGVAGSGRNLLEPP